MPQEALHLGVIMDPIERIKPYKDSTLAMLLAAQKRGFQLHYILQNDLFVRDGQVYARTQNLQVFDDTEHWFKLEGEQLQALTKLDTVLMRVDPPFNMEYIYTTLMLERAAADGLLVVNDPAALRLINEKLYISWFSDFTPATLVSSRQKQLREFLHEQGDIVVKPLDGMGGQSIFRIKEGDQNTSVILESMTANDTSTIMAQQYIPDIKTGDKRILLVNGEPIPYALARIPASGELRGNLAAGGRGEGQALTKRDFEICAAVGPRLRELGILFAGLDVIGEYLTEINVTSPTCIRELDAIYKLDIAGQLIDTIQSKLKQG